MPRRESAVAVDSFFGLAASVKGGLMGNEARDEPRVPRAVVRTSARPSVAVMAASGCVLDSG